MGGILLKKILIHTVRHRSPARRLGLVETGAVAGTLPALPDHPGFWIHRERIERTMADINVRRRGPGARPWILGILMLAALAALGLWLLDERADDRALDGVSATAE
jgi:hypothetical protein